MFDNCPNFYLTPRLFENVLFENVLLNLTTKPKVAGYVFSLFKLDMSYSNTNPTQTPEVDVPPDLWPIVNTYKFRV